MSIIRVEQKKLAGFEPRWAAFRGFTVLFDNPGDSTIATGEARLDLCCPVGRGVPELALYDALSRSVEAMGRERLTCDYLFAPIAPMSYHVTLWDGINDGNAGQLEAPRQAEAEELLGHIRQGRIEGATFLDPVRQSRLLRSLPGEIRLRLAQVENWGDSAVVARLGPADDASAGGLHQIETLRAELSALYDAEFGVSAYSGYSPHVSLGYLANRSDGAGIGQRIDEWNEIAHALAGERAITFRTASIYGFTDMVTFFKAAGLPVQSA
jgi:hypothetical protein